MRPSVIRSGVAAGMSRDLGRGWPVATCAVLGVGAVAASRLVGLDTRVRLLLEGAGWLILLGSAWSGHLANLVRPERPFRPVRPVRPSEAQDGSIRTTVALAGVTVAVLLEVGLGAPDSWTTWCWVIGALVSVLVRKLVADRDESASRRALVEQAATDPLTGLGNRRALDAALAELFGPAREAVNFLTVDLDNFKFVNTLLGHQVGDQLLQRVAATISSVCGDDAFAFRLGGDEFALLTRGSESDATLLGAHLIEEVDRATQVIPGVTRVNVSASVGVAHCPAAGDPVAQEGGVPEAAGDPVAQGFAALARSGEAMRAAKDAGRARVMVYDQTLARQHNRHLVLERRLRRAVRQGGVELAYQPIISLPEMRMVGVESLARWVDEEIGPVGPDEFIPVAEDCGLIVELGLQLARRSMEGAVASGSHAAGLVGGYNVSPTQLRHPGYVPMLSDLLRELAFNPAQFVLEVTESVQIEADDPAVAALWKLSELGFPIAIDDFGTGYSSLSLLSRLPAKILKLDRSLTQQLHEPRGLAIARCVTQMARALDVDVVAEGIETPEQLFLVRSLGIGFGQGWLFSKAVPLERFSEFVTYPRLVLAHLPAELTEPSLT